MKMVAGLHHLLIVGGALVLSACATVSQPPADALRAADVGIANAERDGAADYAPAEMRTAHEKIAAARESAKQSDQRRAEQSRRLADEARVDAELASAKSNLVKANAMNRELQKSIDILRQEAQRGSGKA